MKMDSKTCCRLRILMYVSKSLVVAALLSVMVFGCCSRKKKTSQNVDTPGDAIYSENQHRYADLEVIYDDLTKPAGQAAIEEEPVGQQFGVKVERMTLSSAGYMLDFRYRIIDAEKAMVLADKRNKPYLIDAKTGARLIVPTPPKVGNLSQASSKPIKDKIYFVMFANPGRLVKVGDEVSVVIGDYKTENITVQ